MAGGVFPQLPRRQPGRAWARAGAAAGARVHHPQDGAEKQDCERSAAKLWLSRHGPGLASLRPVYLGDDLFACQPIVAAIKASGGSFILTCKPSSHQTVSEYLHGVKPEEHRETTVKHGKCAAVILHCIWTDGTRSEWGAQKAAQSLDQNPVSRYLCAGDASLPGRW